MGNDEAGPGPKSWAEDLKSYRATRGSRSLSTIQDAGVPERYSRTNYVPFCDTRHPLFPYNDFVDGKGTVRVDPHVTAERYARHGWGETSLLKEEGYSGTLHTRSAEHRQGRARPPSPRGYEGQRGMFGVIQMTEAGGPDDWIGHPLVDPSKGKRHIAAPADPKGRRDLFDVLHERAPGIPADDAWLGHKQCDPAKGRAVPPPPASTKGRRDLSDIISCSILNDPRRLELLQKGADPLGDGWCGHKHIDPEKGRHVVASAPGATERLHGAVFLPDAKMVDGKTPYTDLPRRHNKHVPPSVPATAGPVMRGEGEPVDDRGRLGRKAFPELPAPRKYDGRKDLYAHMKYRPLTADEVAKYSRAFDDRGGAWPAHGADAGVSAFPRANISARNGCTPGIPTPYMIMCLELSVDPDVDLVFVEYTLNDAYNVDMTSGMQEEAALEDNRIVVDSERLLRRLLALPRRPAVVMLHSTPVGLANYPLNHPKHPKGAPYRPFLMTSEDLQGALAQYYDVQYLSLRTALYRLAAHKDVPGFRWEDLFVDHHPGDAGHKVMADLAVHLLQRTALGLLMEPFGQQDAEAAAEPLPPPMYPGNEPPGSPMCRAGEGVRSMVTLAEGFDFISEGSPAKPKPGYVAHEPGSRLQLAVNTDRRAMGAEAGEPVGVYLHHLRSYSGMGTARISCVSGCSCAPAEVDASTRDRVSQTYLAAVAASQARQCVVQIEVLNRTSSGGHKFKVSGVVVAETAGRQSRLVGVNAGHNQRFGLLEHVDESEQMTFSTAASRRDVGSRRA
ncbi:hypothetical protein GPECTOR_11g322 [Gonium pectorale]|uniref:SGNH hydrolase-type esterase domain-containing protein n=1 Tax=Gonium pectorale TaxID=33097 RepID=A0A150GQ71_GONPE|nr:hypothetical protein GPECTOR_11g322 [Gonium pectorale]|eukprot:KXZ51888.1 hypothetical protein GPECTOR_11g322 [Gonium pectorale]